jgi:hypothetical protein
MHSTRHRHSQPPLTPTRCTHLGLVSEVLRERVVHLLLHRLPLAQLVQLHLQVLLLLVMMVMMMMKMMMVKMMMVMIVIGVTCVSVWDKRRHA